MEEIESYLFIGGIKDGEWFNLSTACIEYNFPVLDFRSAYRPGDLAENFGWQEKYDVKYIKVKIAKRYRPDQKDLWVFVSEDIYNTGAYTYDTVYDTICKLVNNYKVIK